MGKKLWIDDHIITVYELAKQGKKEAEMAKELGVSLPTYHKWKNGRPIFKEAIKRGRNYYRLRDEQGMLFSDFLIQKLSPDMQKQWNKINRFSKAKGGTAKIDAILENKGVPFRKSLFLKAWFSRNWNISAALKLVGLSRNTFEMWKRSDPKFLELVEEIEWCRDNFFEEQVMMQIKGGDTSILKQVMASKLAHRGYANKSEIDMNLTGGLTTKIVSIDDLNMTLEQKKELLQAIRKIKKATKSDEEEV